MTAVGVVRICLIVDLFHSLSSAVFQIMAQLGMRVPAKKAR